MRRGTRRWGRTGCGLEIMLAPLFSLAHALVAWRIWAGWRQVPASAPARVVYMIYWGPPFLMLGPVADLVGAPRGGITGLMLLPLAWATCFVYGWLTAIALCLPFRLRRRR